MEVQVGEWRARLRKVRWWDVFFYAVILYMLIERAPGWLETWRQQGAKAHAASVMDLGGASVAFPPKGVKSVVVFWATWCGPCKLELGRLKAASDEGKIDPAKVLAVSIGEEATVVKQAVKERGYPFKQLLDTSGELAQAFKVAATPTVMFLDEAGTIEWATSGVSPSLVLRAERFIPR